MSDLIKDEWGNEDWNSFLELFYRSTDKYSSNNKITMKEENKWFNYCAFLRWSLGGEKLKLLKIFNSFLVNNEPLDVELLNSHSCHSYWLTSSFITLNSPMLEKRFWGFLHPVYSTEQLERKMNHRQPVGTLVSCLSKCVVEKRKRNKYKLDEL